VVGKIVHLRKTYHFGPAKIAMYLKRYHDLEVSTSGVWRILKRLEMNRLPAALPPTRRPVEALREAAAWAPCADRREVRGSAEGLPEEALPVHGDRDCTRIRVLRIYDRLNQTTAIRFVDYVLEKLPFAVEVIQTDMGRSSDPSSTTTSWTSGSGTWLPPDGTGPCFNSAGRPRSRARRPTTGSWSS
jgi:hypothetical protein